MIQTAEVGRGAWDVAGDWNKWAYAAVELIESHKTKAEFERDYRLYIELLRELAKQAKIPQKLDAGNMGINTHDYCRTHQPNNKTDHVDPYPYLAKWGISRAQFKKDVENGLSGSSNSNGGGYTSSTPGKNTKPLTNGKVGDTVKIFDALYKDSDGKGRSTKMRGKTGVIKKIANGKGKKYLVETWGWAHPNDLQLVKSGATDTGYQAKKVGQTVKVQSWATTYQTGQKIASFIRGKSYKIKQVKSVNQSKSKRAYLLDGINSWVLEQDVK
ncbi:hypothetical protein RV11_GL003519 [Enterococcus phoeniculicola]|nr:hypothetical protein RV11_GL003519 [Enterococcus phoeniculicola]